MDDREKLKHLLTHWTEHNAEHVRTYREWAKRAEDFGNMELSEVLYKLADETAGAEKLLRKARGLL